MEVPKAYQFLYKQYVELYNRPLPVETVHEYTKDFYGWKVMQFKCFSCEKAREMVGNLWMIPRSATPDRYFESMVNETKK